VCVCVCVRARVSVYMSEIDISREESRDKKSRVEFPEFSLLAKKISRFSLDDTSVAINTIVRKILERALQSGSQWTASLHEKHQQ